MIRVDKDSVEYNGKGNEIVAELSVAIASILFDSLEWDLDTAIAFMKTIYFMNEESRA